MLTQNGDCNFFQSDPTNQKKLIDSVFSLSAIQSLERLLKDGVRCHNGVADLYEAYLAGVQKKAEKAKVNANREALEEQIEEGQGLLMELEVRIQEAHQEWSALAPRVFGLKSFDQYKTEYNGMEDGAFSETIGALKDERGRLEGLVLRDSGVVKKPTGKEVRFQGLAERLEDIGNELKLLNKSDGPVSPSLTIEGCHEIIQEYRIWKRGKVVPNPVEPLEILAKITEQTRVYHGMILSQRISGVPCEEEGTRKEIERLKKLLAKSEEQQALVQKLIRHEQDYPLLERRLAQIVKDVRDCEILIGDSQKFKFNPDCFACREQPFKKAEEDARQRLVTLKAERKTLQTQWQAMDDYDSLADLIGKRKEAQKVLKGCEEAERKIEELTANLRFTAWQNTERDARESYEKAKLAEEAKRWTTRIAEAEASLAGLLLAEKTQ
jgi:D-Tyr-tRNAtyr deacylase